MSYYREQLVAEAIALADADVEDEAAFGRAVARLCRAAQVYAVANDATREERAGTKYGRPIRRCVECGRVMEISAHGRCASCYRRRRRNAAAIRGKPVTSVEDGCPETLRNQIERNAA